MTAGGRGEDEILGAEIAKVVGERVAIRREALGLSQEELAHQAGLHRTAISPLELGKHGFRLETVFRIAGALGVPPADLIQRFYWVPDESGGHLTDQPPAAWGAP